MLKIAKKRQKYLKIGDFLLRSSKVITKVKNIYKEPSYQEIIDINKITNKEAQLREVEFGLVPNQLMVKECSKRDKKEVIIKGKEITDQECDLQCHDSKFNAENDIFKAIEGLNVVKIASFNQDKLQIILGGCVFVERKVSYSIFDKIITIATLTLPLDYLIYSLA